ncbi:MAG TPA: hypothetical protein DCL15_16965 [Chloroflexi bacterium]|nr:hypothetical protein [Chloroflexota bacterium]HHW85264.1 hypothetical protein [Chloroflexota bacterium]
MSDDKSNRSGARRSRRRFFRPKKETPGQAPAPEPTRPPENKQAAARQRKARRKAHSRQRAQEEVRAQNNEADVAYVAPKTVFIYTHSAHPEMRDSYEFRPEHFSNVGRRLEDYQIDISALFAADKLGADNLPVVKSLPKPDFNWTDWEEEEE